MVYFFRNNKKYKSRFRQTITSRRLGRPLELPAPLFSRTRREFIIFISKMNFSRRGNIAGYFIVGSSDVPLHIALLEKPDTEFCDTI